MHPKIDRGKSIEKRCKNEAKMDPKWFPNHVKIRTKSNSKIDTEKGQKMMQKRRGNHQRMGLNKRVFLIFSQKGDDV